MLPITGDATSSVKIALLTGITGQVSANGFAEKSEKQFVCLHVCRRIFSLTILITCNFLCF